MTGEPKLRIEYEPLADDIYEVRLTGELGMGSVSSLERVFENIFEQGAYRVIVNLEQASYIASSGIGILVSSCKTAKDNGGDFILCSIMPKVKQVFDMVGLQNIVRYAQNTKDALRILNKRK